MTSTDGVRSGRRRRLAASTAFAVALALAAALLLAGCGGKGSDVNCTLNDCTVTFDRGVDASASILGVDVKLVQVQDGQVTLEVAGNQVQVPIGGDAQTQAEGLQIRVDSVTDDQVVVKISRGGGGGN